MKDLGRRVMQLSCRPVVLDSCDVGLLKIWVLLVLGCRRFSRV